MAVGRAAASAGSPAFPLVAFAPAPHFAYHDPHLMLMGLYVCLHITHTAYLTLVGVVNCWASWLCSIELRRLRHTLGWRGTVARVAVMGVALLSIPVCHLALAVRHAGGLHVVRNAHTRVRPLLATAALAFVVVPTLLGVVVSYLDVWSSHTALAAAWLASPASQLLRSWLSGSLAVGIVYDLAALGFFGDRVGRAMDTIDLKVMEVKVRRVLRRVVVPALAALVLACLYAALLHAVIHPRGRFTPTGGDVLALTEPARNTSEGPWRLPNADAGVAYVPPGLPCQSLLHWVQDFDPALFGYAVALPADATAVEPPLRFTCTTWSHDTCRALIYASEICVRFQSVVMAWMTLALISCRGRQSMGHTLLRAWQQAHRVVKDTRYKRGVQLRNWRGERGKGASAPKRQRHPRH